MDDLIAEITEIQQTKLARFVLDDGEVIEVAMSPELAERIHRMDRAQQERDRRRRKREKCFTDLGIDGRHIRKRLESLALKGNPWEGPRFQFTLIIGESRIWPGPRAEDVGPLIAYRIERGGLDDWCKLVRPGYPDPCEFCKSLPLPSIGYCERCNACGRDGDARLIPSAADLRLRAPKGPPRIDEELAGGVGKSQGGKEPKPEPAKRKGKGKRRAKVALKGGTG